MKLFSIIIGIIVVITGIAGCTAPVTTSQPSLLPSKTAPAQPAKANTAPADTLDSPFGIHDPSVPEVDSVADVAATGAKWVRYAGRNGLVWDFIEPQKGVYNWTLHDQLYLTTSQNAMKMNVVVLPYNKIDSAGREFGYIPRDMDWYLSFLKKAVERYDGDGVGDAPGSPIVDVWEIDNEPDLSLNQGGKGFKDTPQNYALLLKESYKVIKKANPSARVAFAGLAGPAGVQNFMVASLDELESIKDAPNDRYFDIAGFHWSGQLKGDYQKEILPRRTYYLEQTVNEMKAEMAKRGYADIPIWIGEMSYNDGKPRDLPFLATPRSETEQAVELLKRYVYSLTRGVGKIFWVTLTEWSNFGGGGVNNYFDNVGLINNPATDGKSGKKLAYFTYLKMTETLEGSDWSDIQTVQEKDGIYIYKFMKQGEPTWVAWNDTGTNKTVTMALSDKITAVRISEAVPDGESGKEVTDYSKAFKVIPGSLLHTDPAQLRFELGTRPVYIEAVDQGQNIVLPTTAGGNQSTIRSPGGISTLKLVKKVEISNAARPEIAAYGDRVFVLYLGNISSGRDRTFNVQIYESKMETVIASKTLVSTTAEYGGPTDIRIAADGQYLYAFYETNRPVTQNSSATYLWGARYTLDESFNRVAYTTIPIAQSRPMAELQDGGELVDDPAPLVTPASVFVVTRLKYSISTAGKTVYRVREFDKEKLTKLREFDLDLSAVADGRGRVTSLFYKDNHIYVALATTVSDKGLLEGNDDGAMSDIILIKMNPDWTFDSQEDRTILTAEPDDRENYIAGLKSVGGYFFLTYKQAVGIPPSGDQIAWIKIFTEDFKLVHKEKIKSVKWGPTGGEIRPSIEVNGHEIYSGQSGGLGLGKGNAEIYLYEY